VRDEEYGWVGRVHGLKGSGFKVEKNVQGSKFKVEKLNR
jgi:hypothetical protein